MIKIIIIIYYKRCRCLSSVSLLLILPILNLEILANNTVKDIEVLFSYAFKPTLKI